MQIYKRNLTFVLSLSTLMLLAAVCIGSSFGQAKVIERIALKDALGWEVAQDTSSDNSNEKPIQTAASNINVLKERTNVRLRL